MMFKSINYNYNYNYNKHIIRLINLMIISIVLASCTYDKQDLPVNKPPITQSPIVPIDTTSLNFFIISDWGYNGFIDQMRVKWEMNKIAKIIKLRYILTCGDNFQNVGVTSVNDPLWQLNYVNVYNDSSLLVPWYPALGNHDYMSNPDAQVQYSSINNYWNMPARYYTYVKQVDSNTYARYIVLDTYDLITKYQSLADTTKYDTIAQYVWLKNILSDLKEKWMFVYGHHPMFSASLVHGDTKELKIMVKPLFDAYNVDFYICGHDHDFEHARESNRGTDYIVTGTGGTVRPIGYDDKTIFSLSALGFTYISLTADKAKLYFITADNKIEYSYVRNK